MGKMMDVLMGVVGAPEELILPEMWSIVGTDKVWQFLKKDWNDNISIMCVGKFLIDTITGDADEGAQVNVELTNDDKITLVDGHVMCGFCIRVLKRQDEHSPVSELGRCYLETLEDLRVIRFVDKSEVVVTEAH